LPSTSSRPARQSTKSPPALPYTSLQEGEYNPPLGLQATALPSVLKLRMLASRVATTPSLTRMVPPSGEPFA
jgi:hypothetical protein